MPSERIEFRNRSGDVLAGRLDTPAGAPRAFALFAHCFTCSKDLAAATRIAIALADAGLAVLRFDFTGLGSSEGEFANTGFRANVDDLVAAADWLRFEHRAPQLLIGHSLGGAAVLLAATRIAEVRAVATIGAPSEPGHVRRLLQDDLATIRAEGAARVQLAGREFTIGRQLLDDLEALDGDAMRQQLRHLHRAVLIFHSPADEVVPIDEARRLYDALLHPKSFVSLDDADHLLTRRADAEDVATVLAAWARRYVGTDAAAPPPAEALPEGAVLVREREGLLQDVIAGHHRLLADEPLRAGGTDRGPTPYDLLLAALGACTSMTLRMYARHKSWPLDRVAVRLTHAKVHADDCADCERPSARIDRIERELVLHGPLDDAQRQRLLEIAERCPVHRTLMGQKDIVTRLAAP